MSAAPHARPHYERPEDLQREHQAVWMAANLMRLRPRKLPERYKLDYFLYSEDGKARAVCEVKSRTYHSGHYPAYMLSAEKWAALVQWSGLLKVPMLLVVAFTDGVWAGQWDADEARCFFSNVEQRARVDRNDSQDSEPMVFIPMGEFHKIGGPAFQREPGQEG